LKQRRRMGLAPEGAGIIIFSVALVIAAVLYSISTGGGRGLWLPAIAAVWFLAVVQFFRDPERRPPSGGNLVLAPADGKVVVAGAMEKAGDPNPGIQVSIFMSPINVHVNRSPVTGEIKRVEHRSGKFVSAFKPEASRINEQTEVALATKHGTVTMKQIAGFLARRIVFHPKPGDRLSAGARVGMIRFGSRVDIHIPGTVELKIKVGDRVTAGETIIGEFKIA
jgi:phosphatidylserine decarboxylase